MFLDISGWNWSTNFLPSLLINLKREHSKSAGESLYLASPENSLGEDGIARLEVFPGTAFSVSKHHKM